MKIKFFSSPYRDPGNARYQHTSVVLAEGLRELGVPYFGDREYWWDLSTNCYLISDGGQEDADVYVYSSQFLLDFPSELEKIDYSKITILIDNEDGFYTPSMDDRYGKFDLILRCHYNKKFKEFKHLLDWDGKENWRPNYLKNVVPWNYALSYRMIEGVKKSWELKTENRVLSNFRMYHNYRQWSVEGFTKGFNNQIEIYNNITDSLEVLDTDDNLSYWAQTGRRHNEQFYSDINSSKLLFAFGGRVYYDPSGSRFKELFGRAFCKIANLMSLPPQEYRFNTMTQYGGWRLFEGFLANTVPIQLNFDYWGLDWPVNPIHKKHYWGVDGYNFEASAKELLSLSDRELSDIAQEGKEWVMRNYSPRVVASRFIDHIENLK